MDFSRPRKRHQGLDLTPLIDVVFLLIVFLILTANFQQPSLSLDLPSGTSEDEAREHVVLVELDAQGKVALDGVPLGKASLKSSLEVALEPLNLRAVRLLADEALPYGQLLPAIEEIREAGALAIDLVHDGGRE